jgi:hypothetical protein
MVKLSPRTELIFNSILIVDLEASPFGGAFFSLSYGKRNEEAASSQTREVARKD